MFGSLILLTIHTYLLSNIFTQFCREFTFVAIYELFLVKYFGLNLACLKKLSFSISGFVLFLTAFYCFLLFLTVSYCFLLFLPVSFSIIQFLPVFGVFLQVFLFLPVSSCFNLFSPFLPVYS